MASARKMKIMRNGSVLASAISKSASASGEPIETTDDQSEGWRTYDYDAGLRSVDISIEGVTKDEEIREAVFDGLSSLLLEDVTLEYPNGDILSGDFFLNGLEEGGPAGDALKFSSSLQSSGSAQLNAPAVAQPALDTSSSGFWQNFDGTTQWNSSIPFSNTFWSQFRPSSAIPGVGSSDLALFAVNGWANGVRPTSITINVEHPFGYINTQDEIRLLDSAYNVIASVTPSYLTPNTPEILTAAIDFSNGLDIQAILFSGHDYNDPMHVNSIVFGFD